MRGSQLVLLFCALNSYSPAKRKSASIIVIFVKYSRRLYVYDNTTTLDVGMRRVFVWRLLGSMRVETMACMGKTLGAVEMFWEHSGITLGGDEHSGPRLERRE